MTDAVASVTSTSRLLMSDNHPSTLSPLSAAHQVPACHGVICNTSPRAGHELDSSMVLDWIGSAKMDLCPTLTSPSDHRITSPGI